MKIVGVTSSSMQIVGVTGLCGLWALKHVANFFLDQSIDLSIDLKKNLPHPLYHTAHITIYCSPD